MGNNYRLGRTCGCCGVPICDFTQGPHCRGCFGSEFIDRGAGLVPRVPMIISPWQVIENGVRMRTVESS